MKVDSTDGTTNGEYNDVGFVETGLAQDQANKIR